MCKENISCSIVLNTAGRMQVRLVDNHHFGLKTTRSNVGCHVCHVDNWCG